MNTKDELSKAILDCDVVCGSDIYAYVVDLKAYNNEEPVGMWMKCTENPSEMKNIVNDYMDIQSRIHNEDRYLYTISGWRGPYDPGIGKPDWKRVAEIVKAYNSSDDYKRVYAAISLGIHPSRIEEMFCGCVKYVEDFFRNKLSNECSISDECCPVNGYINWTEYARDQIVDGPYEAAKISWRRTYIFKTGGSNQC